MSNMSFKSVMTVAGTFVVMLALLAASGCGDPPESSARESMQAAPEQEPSDATMAPETGSGQVEGAEVAGEHREGGEEGGGEHGEGGEHEGDHEHSGVGEGGGHGEEGEESGEYIGRTQSRDAMRGGIRLTLLFDEAQNAFTGTVENTTRTTICDVRVEVHLSNGTELGPTERMDLDPGESAATLLSSEGEAFERWTAHPETSPCAAPVEGVAKPAAPI